MPKSNLKRFKLGQIHVITGQILCNNPVGVNICPLIISVKKKQSQHENMNFLALLFYMKKNKLVL